MKVVFGCSREESDVYDYPDGTSERKLLRDAADWVADNVEGFYEIIDEEEDEG